LSGHESNIVSKDEVNKYISSFENLSQVLSGMRCSVPLVEKNGKGTVTGIAFGKAVFLTLSFYPFHMEDLPTNLKRKIEDISKRNGFDYAIVVDSHNCYGEKIVEDFEDLVKASEIVLNRLKSAQQHPFKIGYAHSSQLENSFQSDIGPAGIGVLIFQINNFNYALVASDSNNAVVGLRDEVQKQLNQQDIDLIELCTSDTHVNSGRNIGGSKGYFALGEETNSENILSVLWFLTEKGLNNASNSNFTINYSDSSIKVIGQKYLDRISIGLDQISSIAKIGGSILVAYIIIVIAISILI
jgi:putative membrane protein